MNNACFSQIPHRGCFGGERSQGFRMLLLEYESMQTGNYSSTRDVLSLSVAEKECIMRVFR